MAINDSTVAISLIIHGDAVRLNRGKTHGDDFDFKHMKGPNGSTLPYVSSQCFKKYWRETLPVPYSPITRGTNAAGAEKNQVYTDGNPVLFVDDDLFGYMKAGANSEQADTDDDQISAPDSDDAQLDLYKFDPDDFQDKTALLSVFKKGKKGKEQLYQGMQRRLPEAVRADYDRISKDPTDDLFLAIIEAINFAIENPAKSGHVLEGAAKKAVEGGAKTHSQLLREFFDKEFDKALRPKLPTTKRTSPIRMHALVAFSGVYTAKDFQTFARGTAYTGKNAVLNPSTVGIYSGWLKTRVLIEGHRIGKFYLGENRDMVKEQLPTDFQALKTEIDPYDKDQKEVTFVHLDDATRKARLKTAIQALANIGNRQGPASGALHDGSLRPKGFIGAFMNCADSPFDSVWQGTDDLPFFDAARLKAIILDWYDLFASKTIYIGWPIEMKFSAHDMHATLMGSGMGEVLALGFTFEVGTPRQTLLRMALDAAPD